MGSLKTMIVIKLNNKIFNNWLDNINKPIDISSNSNIESIVKSLKERVKEGINDVEKISEHVFFFLI